MEILTSTQAVRQWRQAQSKQDKTIGLVPTMGNLHAGHLSLIALTQQHADCCIASVFVNPTQFGPTEDYEAYPRTWEADCHALRTAHVDAVFAPTGPEILYPSAPTEQVGLIPPHAAHGLCGAWRPSHFSGVLQVVNKLFNLIQPDYATFGEKDYQQLTLIRLMVRDFLLPIRILSSPVIREPSGLAMSSRNQRLSNQDRQIGAQLSQHLFQTRHAWLNGDLQTPSAQTEHCQTQLAHLNSVGFRMQYYEMRRADTLQTLDTRSPDTPSMPAQHLSSPHQDTIAVLAAGYLGETRLIDNTLIQNASLI
jgi:pantoate--beta-alanine ligase